MKSHKKEARYVLTLLLGESSKANDEVTMMKKDTRQKKVQDTILSTSFG